MRKGIKIFLIISISVAVLMTLLISTVTFFITNIEIKFFPDKQEPSIEQTADEDILAFLQSEDVINKNDVYINYDRDIGLFGPEGDKRYIYRRDDMSCYYVEIGQLEFSSHGEFCGYDYKPNEVFYSVIIQDCRYNINAESMDERILDWLGDKRKYIISTSKNDFVLHIAELSDESAELSTSDLDN